MNSYNQEPAIEVDTLNGESNNHGETINLDASLGILELDLEVEEPTVELGSEAEDTIIEVETPNAESGNHGGSITIDVRRILETVDIHRYYQPESGIHFYSQDNIGKSGYSFEQVSFSGLASDRYNSLLNNEVIEIEGAKPVYQFFNNDTQAYLFTMDNVEKDYILDNLDNYSLEGIAYYAFENEPENIETIPVYRMYNTDTGTHMLTSDLNEVNSVQTNLDHFNLEGNNGITFYALEA